MRVKRRSRATLLRHYTRWISDASERYVVLTAAFGTTHRQPPPLQVGADAAGAEMAARQSCAGRASAWASRTSRASGSFTICRQVTRMTRRPDATRMASRRRSFSNRWSEE